MIAFKSTPRQQDTLRHYWKTNPQKFKGMRQYEIAQALGISEGEWVDACVGYESQRLVSNPKRFISMLPFLGEVKVLTQTESAVHEKIGSFDHIEFSHENNSATVNNHRVDLQISLQQWHRIYAIRVKKGRYIHHSLQVFNIQGTAIHKIFMMPQTHNKRWHSFVESRLSPDDTPFRARALSVLKRKTQESISLQGFRDSWDNLLHPQNVPDLLKRYNLNHADALQYAGGDRAVRTDHHDLKTILDQVSAQQISLLIQVANCGCKQTHNGPIQNIVAHQNWLTIFDDDFNLHLNTNHIAEAWIVKKPSANGLVSSLELFDAAENLIVTLSDEKISDMQEREPWQNLLRR